MTNQIETWPAGSTWAYRAVFKESGAGGGTITVDVTPGAGNEMLIMSIHMGADNYGANRTVTVRLEDSANNRIQDIFSSGTIDNTHTNLPLIGSDSTLGDWSKLGGQGFIVSGTDSLTFIAASLAQNEELTIAIRARLKGKMPAITAASTGTIGTTVTTYSKVL